MRNKQLPYLPSKLLAVALKDLEAVETSSNYRINMSYYIHKLTGTDDTCLVCLAGAVMVNTLQINEDEYSRHAGLYEDNKMFARKSFPKFYALDAYRQGDYINFLEKMSEAHKSNDEKLANEANEIAQKMSKIVKYVTYSTDPVQFKSNMRLHIEYLKGINL